MTWSSINSAFCSVPRVDVPHGFIVGGAERLLDAWATTHSVHLTPTLTYPQHRIEFCIAPREIRPRRRQGVARNFFNYLRRHDTIDLPDSAIAFDCRHDSSGNVSHVLQGQVGVALTGLAAFGLESRASDLVFVVRSDTPAYGKRLFEVLGFRAVAASSAVVRGQQLWMNPNVFPLRAFAARSLRRHALASGLLGDRDPPGEPLFLARRGRRTLRNLDEIEAITVRHGYRTVFAEDLPIDEQIQLVSRASSLFALHGAAMGFMMFRSSERRGVVIECFSCGYPTGWARAICRLTNDLWLGGMGDLDADVIKQRLGTAHPRKFEALDYRLDPSTAEALLAMAATVDALDDTACSLETLIRFVPGVRFEFSTRQDGTLDRRAVIDTPELSDHQEGRDAPSAVRSSSLSRSRSTS